MSKELNIPRPSPEEVGDYLKIWNNDDDLKLSDSILRKLFTRTYPVNNNLEEVVIKVCTLDILFNTNVGRWALEVSRHISNYKNFDNELTNNKLDVDKFAKVRTLNKKLYSFATKYCSFHGQDNYPMYDSRVDETLWYFKNKYQFKKFTRPALRQYSEFKIILEEFRSSFGLEKFSLREIDKYLWLVGKEFFN